HPGLRTRLHRPPGARRRASDGVSSAERATPGTTDRRTGTGMVLALVSALVFGTSGAFAKGLLDAGWSPAAAVTARATIAAVLLAVPACLALRGRWRLLL